MDAESKSESSGRAPTEEQLDAYARRLIPRLNRISELTPELEDTRKRCPIPKCRRYVSTAYGTVYFRLPDELRELQVCHSHKLTLIANAGKAGRLLRDYGGSETITLTHTEAARLWRTWKL